MAAQIEQRKDRHAGDPDKPGEVSRLPAMWCMRDAWMTAWGMLPGRSFRNSLRPDGKHIASAAQVAGCPMPGCLTPAVTPWRDSDKSIRMCTQVTFTSRVMVFGRLLPEWPPDLSWCMAHSEGQASLHCPATPLVCKQQQAGQPSFPPLQIACLGDSSCTELQPTVWARWSVKSIGRVQRFVSNQGASSSAQQHRLTLAPGAAKLLSDWPEQHWQATKPEACTPLTNSWPSWLQPGGTAAASKCCTLLCQLTCATMLKTQNCPQPWPCRSLTRGRATTTLSMAANGTRAGRLTRMGMQMIVRPATASRMGRSRRYAASTLAACSDVALSEVYKVGTTLLLQGCMIGCFAGRMRRSGRSLSAAVLLGEGGI